MSPNTKRMREQMADGVDREILVAALRAIVDVVQDDQGWPDDDVALDHIRDVARRALELTVDRQP